MIINEWRYFLLALGFFTRIPVPQFPDFVEEELNHSAKYFPLIGIMIGFFGALTFVISMVFVPQSIAVLISMASTVYLTGAFHEDGLADSADGIGGGWKRQQILTIMQDSRIGTFGVVALFLVLLTKFQLLSSMNSYYVPFALITSHAISRLAAVWMMKVLNYAKFEGKAKPLATKLTFSDFIIANGLGWLPYISILFFLSMSHSIIFIAQLVFMTLIPMLLAWLWWYKKIKYWLDGYTGDTLGAMQQITELAFYLGLIIWSVNH